MEESWEQIAGTLGFGDEAEMLKHLYEVEGFSLKQLGKVLGASTFTVRDRLLRAGVILRGRGGANNRLGKRKLAGLPTERLFSTSVTELCVEFLVNPCTVAAERRLRKSTKIKEQQLQ